jgi:hypothetical protein
MASMLGHVLGAEAVLGLTSRMGPAALATKRAMWLAGAVAPYVELTHPQDLNTLVAGKREVLKAGAMGIDHAADGAEGRNGTVGAANFTFHVRIMLPSWSLRLEAAFKVA